MATVKVGIIGLGKMGQAVAFRLLKAGHSVFGFDPNYQACQNLLAQGGQITERLDQIPQHAPIIWLMVPAGKTVDTVLEQIRPHLQPQYIIIDGGNSHFTDSVRRAQALTMMQVHFLDCGTSGGIHGKEQGFSLMIGGNHAAFLESETIFKALAAPQGYAHVGPSGAGHYVKMIHNGIEYALLQAYAEGFSVLKQGSYPSLDLEVIANIWNHGAVIRSWILELAHNIFEHDQDFNHVSGQIMQNGTGKWTVQEAHEKHIPVTLIENAVNIREWSQRTGGDYATKIVALLRNQFGGHAVKKVTKE